MATYVKIAGTWRLSRVWVKIADVWRDTLQIYNKVSGIWRAVWGYSWVIGSWSSCSKTCGGGIQTRSVVCTRSDGVTLPDGYCDAAGIGTKPAVQQACNTQSCSVTAYSEGYTCVHRDGWFGEAPGPGEGYLRWYGATYTSQGFYDNNACGNGDAFGYDPSGYYGGAYFQRGGLRKNTGCGQWKNQFQLEWEVTRTAV